MRKILIVDDSELNRMLLIDILEEKDFEVEEAENGQEALDILEKNPDEIGGIILDLLMPVMDGYTFLEKYSKLDFCKNIPVVVATADNSPSVERRCLELGAWDFVQKPYDPVIVCLRVQNNMERRRLHLMEQQKISDTFRRYMDPKVVEEVLKDDESSLMGKTVDIAVLFVDIRGFTNFSEQLKPDKVVSVLNKYLALTSFCVKKYGGTLDKFIGDCTMAFWGAPLPCEDACYQACCAAVEMAKRSGNTLKALSREFGRDISFGIGIHYGPAVVGNIGTMERMDYTAIGDTVNTASRLESNAPPGTIYISRAVADALGDRAKTTSLGSSMDIKGKTNKLEILILNELKMN
jgi:class 3 adenylate cyclase